MAGVGPKFLKALAADFLATKPTDSYPVAVHVWEAMVRRTAENLATANPNFQTARFYEACGLWPAAVK